MNAMIDPDERKKARVLVLSPHTDDGELGCGGTIAKLIMEECDLYYAAFSICEKSVPKGLPENILETEMTQATRMLGIKASNILIHRYPVREFPKYRQNILENLVTIKQQLDPDLVLLPSGHDIHQDHATIFQEGIRAFKHTNIAGYELPWNNLSFHATLFVCLEEQYISKKVAAIQKYKSQQKKPYTNEEFIKSLARIRGGQLGTSYAEAFEVTRWIVTPKNQIL